MQFEEITLLDYSRPLAERAKRRKVVGPYRIQPRDPKLCDSIGFYMSDGYMRIADHGAGINLRLWSANDFLGYSRLSQITGYYCDADGEGDTLQPIIARLPNNRGFLAGWTMGAGMCASLGRDIYPNEVDAAIAAHGKAEYDAELSREREEEEEEEES